MSGSQRGAIPDATELEERLVREADGRVHIDDAVVTAVGNGLYGNIPALACRVLGVSAGANIEIHVDADENEIIHKLKPNE